jgi:hypothetical protein
MKKILVLATALALVAMLAIPMAALAADSDPATVDGTVVAANIDVVAPTFGGFGSFSPGDNRIPSTNDGSVTVTQNSQTPKGWTVTAKDTADSGYMWKDGTVWGTNLANKLYISPDNSSWATADVGVSWTAGGGSLSGTMPTYLSQTITNTDPAGDYYITITYTGSINF